MGLGHSPKIVTSNLDIALDVNNIKSYSGAGSNWYNLIDGTNTEATNNTWGNGATAFSIFTFINVLGTSATYAYQPIVKGVPGAASCSFALYHFQTTSTYTNRFGWYAYAGGVWRAISTMTTALTGYHHIGLQYNSVTGGMMWLDGNPYGSRTASGAVGTGTEYVTITGGPDELAGIHQVKCAYFYSRELSDAEMIRNFNALRGRYGI
jgi:hypothetical protein